MASATQLLDAGITSNHSDTPTTFQLCYLCQNIIDHLFQLVELQAEIFEHCESYAVLQESAKLGCVLCAQFGRTNTNETTNPNSKEVGQVEARSPRGKVRVFCHKSSDNKPLHWMMTLELTGNPDRRLRVDPAAIQAPLSSSTGSTIDALPLCKFWLERCTQTHQACRLKTKPRTPTRLLYLGDDKIRLCLSSNLGNCPNYATLSHCWGQLKFTTLTTSTLALFLTKIPDEALPKTFKDAIYITRALGVDYLWIDSLCIIQDDKEDWAYESALMGSVYGDSHFTIAASGALDARYGCFFKRTTPLSCRVRTQSQPSNKEIWYDCFPFLGYGTLKEAPLNSRGWVMQEQILSRRTLGFTDSQSFWECERNTFFESNPDSIEPHNDAVTAGIVSWWDMVTEYSKRKLTQQNDKLVAISSLARREKSLTGDTYVAGLWLNGLEKNLCWSTLTAGQRYMTYVAPSWSWSSCDAGISPYTSLQTLGSTPEEPELCAEVLDTNVVLKSSDPFGQVLSGSLSLSCKYFLSAHLFSYDPKSREKSVKFSSGAVGSWFPIFDDEEDMNAASMGQIEIYIAPILHSKMLTLV